VVSHTFEGGLRGSIDMPSTAGVLTWKLDGFHTELDNDIYGVATSLSAGFFRNIGATRREGLEAALAYKSSRLSVFLNYSLVEATFRSTFTLPSPSNPSADASGNITVVSGDHLPGIPVHQLKVGADFEIAPDWSVGGGLNYFSDQYLRGDESNQTPALPGYAVVNLHTSYRIGKHIEFFASLSNALDSHYATFGEYGDPTGVGAPGVPVNGIAVNNRFLSPSAPIAIFGGTRLKF
jgi:iron complex outermembrane receptor protein